MSSEISSTLRAIQKYRNNHRGEINNKSKERYNKMKENDPDAYNRRLEQMNRVAKERQKRIYALKREERALMTISVS